MSSASTIGNIERAAAVADLLTSQSHLAWSAAIPLMAVEVYLFFRFLGTGTQRRDKCLRGVILGVMGVSILAYAISLFYGYRVGGAAISFVRDVRTEDITANMDYDNAVSNAAYQLLSLVIGLILFGVASMFDFKGVARELAGRAGR